MNLKRSGALLGVMAVGAMTLAACGSDNNASSTGVDTSASTATCEGKEKISAAGSSAQKNAMDQFVATYIAVCQEKGKTVNVAYNPSGSGDGRTQFIAGQIDFAGSDSAIKDEQADKAKERCVGGEAWNLPSSSARSRWPSTSTASTISCSTPRYSPRSSTVASPTGTIRPSPPSTPASSFPI